MECKIFQYQNKQQHLLKGDIILIEKKKIIM